MNPHRFRRFFAAWCIFVVAIAVGQPGVAHAQASLISGFGGPAGYGTSCEYANDDGSSPSIDLTQAFPMGLRFFSQTHRVAFVNNNGNLTFNATLYTYTPSPFPISNQPMIAPYWADVDTRDASCTAGQPGVCANPSQDGVWWHLEPGLMVVTWDRVGYFGCHRDKVMSFQLILTDATNCGAQGDFDVEFRYNRCEWTTGDASSGHNGFGGTPAQAGFDAGDLVHFETLPASLMPNVNQLLCNGSNTGSPGVWHFQIRSGAFSPDAGACTPVTTPPDAGCLTRECLLIEGRAGPLGGCACTTPTPAESHRARRVLGACALGVVAIGVLRRRRRSVR